jgi:hypothetical protein
MVSNGAARFPAHRTSEVTVEHHCYGTLSFAASNRPRDWAIGQLDDGYFATGFAEHLSPVLESGRAIGAEAKLG